MYMQLVDCFLLCVWDHVFNTALKFVSRFSVFVINELEDRGVIRAEYTGGVWNIFVL